MKKIIKKAMIFMLSASLLIPTLSGCGKQEEEEYEEKYILATDFTSYDIARRIADGSDIGVMGLDINKILAEGNGLSGRDRSKINKAAFVINASFLGDEAFGDGIDETKRIGGKDHLNMGDFIDRKKNSSDDNKLYSEDFKLHISKKDNADNDLDSNASSFGGGKNQVVANPNSGKKPDGNGLHQGGNSNSGDNSGNSNENNNGNAGNNDNSGNGNSGNSNSGNPGSNPGGNSGNDNNNGSTNQGGNSGSSGNQGSGNNNGGSGNFGNESDTTYPSRETGLIFKFVDVSIPSAPCSADRSGYSITSFPVGHGIANPNVNPDPYLVWVCDRIIAMSKQADVSAFDFILDDGNGGYICIHNDGMTMIRAKVITMDDIYLPEHQTTKYVICDSSVKDRITLPDGAKIAKADIPEMNERPYVMATTVDYARGPWLDVKNTQVLAEKILEKLIELDPENKTRFEENYEKVKSELESLDDKVQLTVDTSENQTIFIGGSFVYKYMVDSYGIDYVSIYDYSHQDNVSPTRLMNFAKLVDEYTIKYIVKDVSSSMDGITSIRNEINHNLNIVIIDNLESVEDWENSSYFEIMDNNCIILDKALY